MENRRKSSNVENAEKSQLIMKKYSSAPNIMFLSKTTQNTVSTLITNKRAVSMPILDSNLFPINSLKMNIECIICKEFINKTKIGTHFNLCFLKFLSNVIETRKINTTINLKDYRLTNSFICPFIDYSSKLNLIFSRLNRLLEINLCLIKNNYQQQKNIEYLISKYNFELDKALNFEKSLTYTRGIRSILESLQLILSKTFRDSTQFSRRNSTYSTLFKK